ncbi:hypothetical protein CLUG_02060, partial [Clavispora lusitaniae ATCC 42720]
MDGKSTQDGSHNIGVEDSILWSFLAQFSKWLTTRNTQETHRQQDSRNGRLAITKLDTSQVQHRQRVGGNQTVQCQNLVHLDGRNQRTTTLTDNICNRGHIGQFRRERCGNRSVTQLQGWNIVLIASIRNGIQQAVSNLTGTNLSLFILLKDNWENVIL